MTHFTPISALAGGILIGLAAALYLLAFGRIAGISGLFSGLLHGGVADRRTRGAFIVGLAVSGIGARALQIDAVAHASSVSAAVAAGAGLLVGIGTQLGSGCTSGHGICGVSRLSVRSLVATAVFMTAGAATVWMMQAWLRSQA